MPLLDVSFGIFAFLPQGWIFMAFVIFCECFIGTKLLLNKWINRKIFLSIAGSNLISGVLGIIVSMWLNGGWYLVVWFPWVSSNEINLHHAEARNALLIFYIASFILTLIIETITNLLFLRKQYMTRKIIKTTIIVNIVTYTIGTLILYTYSFGLMSITK